MLGDTILFHVRLIDGIGIHRSRGKHGVAGTIGNEE
jgi:hypothetical protein